MALKSAARDMRWLASEKRRRKMSEEGNTA
jgi:hypothetical protein